MWPLNSLIMNTVLIVKNRVSFKCPLQNSNHDIKRLMKFFVILAEIMLSFAFVLLIFDVKYLLESEC